MQQIELQVEGMSCQHCVSSITNGVIQQIAGAEVSVDLSAGKVTVSAQANLNKDLIVDIVEGLGFDVKN